jgi:hypothetical protein
MPALRARRGGELRGELGELAAQPCKFALIARHVQRKLIQRGMRLRQIRALPLAQLARVLNALLGA